MSGSLQQSLQNDNSLEVCKSVVHAKDTHVTWQELVVQAARTEMKLQNITTVLVMWSIEKRM